jgi:predicted nucleic acid-binding protein
MKKIRTYLDTNVLLFAFRGEESDCRRAMAVLSDPRRRFVISDYLRLEALPKPTFHQKYDEVQFMQAILDAAAERVPSDDRLVRQAIELARRYDLSPLDALHASAAVAAAVDEFITFEKPTKPLLKMQELKMTSLYRPANSSSDQG